MRFQGVRFQGSGYGVGGLRFKVWFRCSGFRGSKSRVSESIGTCYNPIAASISGKYDFPTKITTHASLPVTPQSNCRIIFVEGHARVESDEAGVQGSGCSVQCSVFRVQGSGFRVQCSVFSVQGAGFRVQGSVFIVQGAGFRVQGAGRRFHVSGFRFQGSGCRVQGSGCKVQDSDVDVLSYVDMST